MHLVNVLSVTVTDMKMVKKGWLWFVLV